MTHDVRATQTKVAKELLRDRIWVNLLQFFAFGDQQETTSAGCRHHNSIPVHGKIDRLWFAKR
jgi:hypothetical protein